MNNGWIKLHRKFIKWGWYQKSEMVHLFLHFLLLANHEENEWQGNKIKKGQFITGLDKLKQDTGISAQTLRTCIGRLKSTGEITNKSTNRFRLITIVNWVDYQDKDKLLTSKSTGKLTNNQHTTNKQLTANKKLKNDKNDKEVEEKTPTKKPVKKDFIELLEEALIDFKDKLPNDILKVEVQKFILYWTEKNPNGKKEKWEMQSTFDVKRRLASWLKNTEKWDKQKKQVKTIIGLEKFI